MSAIDRLLDMVTRDSLWWSTSIPTTTLAKIETTEEMRILPDTANGPMLEIAQKNAQGVVVAAYRYNLPAVDELIGKLIKMRDHMARMTDSTRG